jgi:hypothetical protein
MGTLYNVPHENGAYRRQKRRQSREYLGEKEKRSDEK